MGNNGPDYDDTCEFIGLVFNDWVAVKGGHVAPAAWYILLQSSRKGVIMNGAQDAGIGVFHAVENMQHRIAGGLQEVQTKMFRLQFLAHAKGTSPIYIQRSPGDPFMSSLDRFDSAGVNAGVDINQSSLIGCLSLVPN